MNLKGKPEKSLMKFNLQWNSLLYSLWVALKILVNMDVELDKDNKNSCVSVLLQKLFFLNPCDAHGNALLHLAVKGNTELSRKVIRVQALLHQDRVFKLFRTMP